MSVYGLAAGLEITSPPPAKAKDPVPSPQNIELDNLTYLSSQNARRSDYNGAITPAAPQTPYEARTVPPTGAQTPKTPNELEMSRPPTPKASGGAAIAPSWSFPKMNKWRVLAACAVYFANGLNDAGM